MSDPIIVGGAKNVQNTNANIPEEFIEKTFVVPTETIPLPSQGMFYPNGQKTVKIKYMTADAEDILFSPELISSGKVLDVVLTEGVVDSQVSVEDMVSGDRNSILLELRKTGLGSEYKPGKMKCPSCGEMHEPTINLDDFKLRAASETPDASGWFAVELPVTKKTIKFRILNGQDEKFLSKTPKSLPGQKNKIKYNKTVTERYIRQIMEVDNTTDKGYIKKFIGIMPLKDSAFLREYIKRVEPGVDTTANVECDKCGHVYEEEIVLNPIKLFYPDANTDE